MTLSTEKDVRRVGNVVFRPRRPWTPFVQDYLHFLEVQNFPSPRVIANNDFDALTFIEGYFVSPNKWSDDALIAIAEMVRNLHDISRYYSPKDAVFQSWFLHKLGAEPQIVSHGDIAPWNMVTTADGMPQTLIDWEYSGWVSPLSELARVCWLFVQLCGDDIADKYDLPPFAYRAKQVRMMCDAYGLSAVEHSELTQRILDVIMLETAEENVPPDANPETHGNLWGLIWRIRSASTIIRNRAMLEAALA